MLSDSDGERELATVYRPDAGVEDALMDDRTVATVSNAGEAASMPQMFVSQCEKVYVGPRYISVTQKVKTTEEIKGQLLGLELVSSTNPRKLRCSIAVFVCWALIVTVGLSFYVFHFALYQNAVIDLDIHEPWYLRRTDWQALPPYIVEYLDLPLSDIVISHSVSGYCKEKINCIRKVLTIQKTHLDSRFYDIAPNFIVTGNGLVIEGRGANVLGSMFKGYNAKSLNIMFLGDYTTDKTIPEQFEHLDVLLNQLVKQGVLVQDYELFGQCQIKTLTVSPGPNIMKELKRFQHWNPKDANLCLSG